MRTDEMLRHLQRHLQLRETPTNSFQFLSFAIQWLKVQLIANHYITDIYSIFLATSHNPFLIELRLHTFQIFSNTSLVLKTKQNEKFQSSETPLLFYVNLPFPNSQLTANWCSDENCSISSALAEFHVPLSCLCKEFRSQMIVTPASSLNLYKLVQSDAKKMSFLKLSRD